MNTDNTCGGAAGYYADGVMVCLRCGANVGNWKNSMTPIAHEPSKTPQAKRRLAILKGEVDEIPYPVRLH